MYSRHGARGAYPPDSRWHRHRDFLGTGPLHCRPLGILLPAMEPPTAGCVSCQCYMPPYRRASKTQLFNEDIDDLCIFFQYSSGLMESSDQ